MIYAKYGIDALRSIARRWPVGGDDLSFTERDLRRFRIGQQHVVRVAQHGARLR
jgi:hypothetical protein